MTKKVTASVLLLVIAVILTIAISSRNGGVLEMLGGREWFRIISASDRIELFQTARLLAMLANGPLPDRDVRIEPGVLLPMPDVQRITRILLDLESYSDDQERWADTASLPPDIVLALTRGRASVEISFSDDLKEMTIRDARRWKKVRCEPAQYRLKEAFGPFLKPTSLY